ncbi:MAG: ABC-type antimicrobial peptide transport system, ATPase component [Candidatus Berkelbacteria bacterium Licking1014_96]|uniref:ABC-type antimicrobial peptide transport system, ATPase component n=1 Tax=Candidatus Berkelbacteria bacterium Licking1014_96 TaxID=2017149 RepID=A0A554LD25_9BACT|nr:MAG: ABC-type antimicrobial peptide transport system, ATPase component [Candidatus Berkelbacteria bacterium Licking1014_96]
MIELKGVSKKYKMGEEIIKALDGVNLKIEKGEFVAIVGPSGSGKTTLANIIGGLDTADSGGVSVDGVEITNAKDNLLSEYRNKKIGFVFQTFNLQPNYTALENVMVPLIFARMGLGERKKRASACLEAVGLENRAKHKPTELSGGERQRVAIARALANNPEIIIADEPTGNLDSKKGSEIISILKDLNRQGKISLIIITHDEGIVRDASRIINIKDGKIN